MPAYFLADLQAGVDVDSVQWSVYVRNLFDRRSILAASTQAVALGAPAQATVARPRTIGLNVTKSF
jgi:outer membrane receptor protein involved in Fe transport